jgi:quercetin dioxygenase-like cupin family protein
MTPDIALGCCSNVYIRQMTFAHAGDQEIGHSHTYDHISLVSSGSALVEVYDEAAQDYLAGREFHAPAMVFVQEGRVHRITATTDNTVVCCVHALRDSDGEIIDPAMFPAPQTQALTVSEYRRRTGRTLTSPITRLPEPYQDRVFE